MKINLIKQVTGELIPADEQSYSQMAKVSIGKVYKCDITLNQNYKLLQKIQCFYDFCCKYYYGDSEAHKDRIKRDHVIYVLKCTAGYFDQQYDIHD